MAMPGRKFSASGEYRYGFNGKENDKNAGEGIQDYGMRIYDNRVAKFLSVDPLTKQYPFYTPYQFAANSPLMSVDIDGMEASNNQNKSETQESGGWGMKVLDFAQNYPEKVTDFAVGSAKAGKDAVVGTYNFVRRDAWKLSTYKNMALTTIAISGCNNVEGLQMMDDYLGTDMAKRSEVIMHSLTRPWSAEDWGYNLTSVGIAVFGPKLTNKAVAITYLAATGDLIKFSKVEGFLLRFGTEDFTYHNSLNAAKKSRWSTPTSFSNPSEAFNALALDYSGTTNFAQGKFSLKNYGLFVEGTAAAQNATLGGGTQLLRTPISLKNLSQATAKKWSLNSVSGY